MNSTNDCILGVLSGPKFGLKYPGIEAYIVSIAKSGFKGHKVMLVWNIHPTTRKYLLKYGFEVIDVNVSNDEKFFHARIRVAKEYLEKRHTEYRYVFWLDIKDLILQSDPSIWMEEHIGSNKLVAASECVTIAQEENNRIWALDVLGRERYEKIKDEEVINGGTWAGEAFMVYSIFRNVYDIIKDYKGNFPPCQPAINFILRQEPFISVLYIPRWSRGFAACLAPMWARSMRASCHSFLRDKQPVLNYKTGLLYPGVETNPKNKMIAFNRNKEEIVSNSNPLDGCELVKNSSLPPFVIVHAYDRDTQLRKLIESKYEMDELKTENGNLVSIFTPSHNPSYLREIYQSLLDQTDQEWEWVIVYNNGAQPVNFGDSRVKEHIAYNMPKWVGPLKATACSYANGDIFLELDHDDLLMPTAVADIKAAFADAEIGFVYSNTVHADAAFNPIDRFSEVYGWKYRQINYKGHTLDEHISFDPTPESISRIWFAPNHLRAFRRTTYETIGGYNTEMRILDDLDLMCRLYQITKFKHIDKGLYIYRVHGNNTWLDPEINNEIQNNVYRIYDQYIEGLIEHWAEINNYRKVEVGGRMAAKAGYETLDLKDADIIADLNGTWPFEDSSVGVIRSFDVFEHLNDPIHTLKEIQRVLVPGGWCVGQVPSTDGRGAFSDPTHKTFWNIASFNYYTNQFWAKYIDTPVRFQAPRLYDTEKNNEGVIWTKFHLINLKDNYRPCGEMLI